MTPWITWKSYYSVGEPSLDNQHKKIARPGERSL